MKWNRTVGAVACAYALVALTGTGMAGGCARRESADPYYNLTVVNAADQFVTEVVLTFGDYELEMGKIEGGATKSEVGCMEPISRYVALRWRPPDGVLRRWETNIVAALPTDFEGEICLTLQPGSSVSMDIHREDK